MLTRALRTKKMARPAGGDSYMHRDFDPWEFFENVEVNTKKKKKRSRCSLCGEQWWGIGVHLIAHWLRPRTGGPEEVWQMYEDQRPANSVWREKCAVFHANTMRVKDAKKAAKFDHAAVG